ncbi:MAG: glycosyltransferase family 39 protein [Chloroflexota bacterium]
MFLGLNRFAAEQPSRPAALLLFGGAAVGIIALHLATNGTLGFHTDELYYLDCGRHPAFGYVDFPPVVPLLARLETGLLGISPWTLRLLPTLLGGFMVALSGAYVRRLGGSLRLQGLALLIAVVAPYFLGANWVFQTVTFDEVIWMTALYWFLCLVTDRRPRYWIYLGITLGIGLEVKYTIVGLIAGIGIAVLLTPSLRATLRTKYPWIAVVIALLIWAPNLVWQVAEGFPSLAYITNHQGSGGGPATYLIELFGYLLFLVPLWLAGLVSLFRTPLLRPIGITCAVPLLLFLFVGKSYYAVGTVPIVMAQGLMALSHVKRPKIRSGLQIAVVVASVLEFVSFVQLTLPITPPNRLHATGLDGTNELFADSVGWDDIAHQVQTVYGNLPRSERSGTVIISAYYGVPGALWLYGNPSRLPEVMSPQLSDWYWLPNHLTAASALMVDYQPSDVSWMCSSARLIDHLTVPYEVTGLEQGAPVTFCQLKAPIPELWGRLRDFS